MKLTDEAVKKLGDLLLAEREKRKLSQAQVKIKLEGLGQLVNSSDIQRIEKGERKTPNAILIKNLCKLYNLDPIDLFREIGYLDPKPKSKSQFSPECVYEKNEMIPIKVYDSIAAGFGYPCEAVECVEEIYIPVKNRQNVVAVRVKGDSMSPRINEGSLILIEKDTEILENEIGVFCLNGDYLVKRKVVSGSGDLILMSENPEYSPILIKSHDDFQELGKVVGIFTWF